MRKQYANLVFAKNNFSVSKYKKDTSNNEIGTNE